MNYETLKKELLEQRARVREQAYKRWKELTRDWDAEDRTWAEDFWAEHRIGGSHVAT